MKPLQQPRNAARLAKAFPTWRSRMDADTVVVVSLCGDAGPFAARHVVFADPGTDYDWHALRRLSVCVLVRKGIDATRTVRGLWDVAYPYLTLADADTGQQAAVLQLEPRLKLWPLPADLPPLRRTA